MSRSVKKGPFIEARLLGRIEEMNKRNEKKVVELLVPCVRHLPDLHRSHDRGLQRQEARPGLTTDIALFGGYALGAAPGFAVGAVAALVSNIFLSQGPWTVWQMAGWGMVGLLARRWLACCGDEPSRLLLAAVCGAAGLAFGAWMDVYQGTLARART